MLESILGPIARDGLEKRDRVYVEKFVVIPLEPGEERVASWMARDVPEGVSWYTANAAVAGNLILTSKRLLFEPHVPPKFGYKTPHKGAGNLLQRINTRGHRYEPLAVALARIRSVEAHDVSDLQGAGAPMKIVMDDDGERRLRILRRSFLRPVFAHAWVNERDRVVRDGALERLSAAVASARPAAPRSKARKGAGRRA
jgi:hypothetical protein